MDTTSTAPAAALPATALPVGADAAMWQDIAGANMEADFESDLAHNKSRILLARTKT